MWLIAAALVWSSPPALADCEEVCEASICPGDLIVSEFMATPDYEPDYRAEWFEVHNASTRNLDLDGLVVSSGGASGDDPGFTVSGTLLVGSGDYVVFGVNADLASNGNVPVDYVYEYYFSSGVGEVQLNRSADRLTLTYEDTVIDSVSWNNAGDWDVVKNQAHHVNTPLVDNAWANDFAQNWCRFVGTNANGWGGTPGEASSQLCADSSVDNDGDGFTENVGDCDDEDPMVNPDAIDGTEAPYGVSGDDADCDGQLDDGACDDDDDGYSEVDGDCDDDLAAVNPIAEEITDGVDNDCNGCIDDVDGDRDGVSECVTGEVVDCDPDDEIECSASTFDPFDAAGAVLPAGYEEGDCAVAWDTNDADNLINPCAPEIRYDGIDQSGDGFDNCDLDGDGYDKEQNADPALGCVGNPDPGFWAERPEDCDDNDPSVYPGGDEGDPEAGDIKDGKDNDCNGVVDDPFKDADLDGYDITQGDCFDDATDPRAAEVNPGADEVCGDGLDNDCNGFVDDGCSTPLGFATVRGGGLCAAAATL